MTNPEPDFEPEYESKAVTEVKQFNTSYIKALQQKTGQLFS